MYGLAIEMYGLGSENSLSFERKAGGVIFSPPVETASKNPIQKKVFPNPGWGASGTEIHQKQSPHASG